MSFKKILLILSILLVGFLGALIFDFFVLPYLLTNSYYEKFEFVRQFKQGKIIVNPTEHIYIQESSAIEGAVQRAKKSIVGIESTSLGIGSGLITTSDGNVVAPLSIIPANGNFKVYFDGESVNFKIVKKDEKNNLVLLKIEKDKLQTVAFADENKTELAQRVFLVASLSSKKDDFLVNEGIISSFTKDIIKTNIIEGKNAIGAPLFNSFGQLIGLSVPGTEGKIFGVSVSVIRQFLGL